MASIALWLPQPRTALQESKSLPPLVLGRCAVSFQESSQETERCGVQGDERLPEHRNLFLAGVLCGRRVRVDFKGIRRSVTGHHRKCEAMERDHLKAYTHFCWRNGQSRFICNWTWKIKYQFFAAVATLETPLDWAAASAGLNLAPFSHQGTPQD